MLINRVRQQLATSIPRNICRLALILKESEVLQLTVHSDISHPLTGVGMPGYPSVRRRCSGIRADVLGIGLPCDSPQISPAIIQPVAVDVIGYKSVAADKAEQFSMQRGRFISTASFHVPSGVPVLRNVPSPLIHPLYIIGVDESVCGYRPFAVQQRDTDGPVTRADRHMQTLGARPISAVVRAERDRVRIRVDEWPLTGSANKAVCSTLPRHRAYSSVSSPGRYNDAGAYCVNYTTPLRVAAL